MININRRAGNNRETSSRCLSLSLLCAVEKDAPTDHRSLELCCQRRWCRYSPEPGTRCASALGTTLRKCYVARRPEGPHSEPKGEHASFIIALFFRLAVSLRARTARGNPSIECSRFFGRPPRIDPGRRPRFFAPHLAGPRSSPNVRAERSGGVLP